MDQDSITTYDNENRCLYYRDAINNLINQYKNFLADDSTIADDMLRKNNTFTALMSFIGNNLFNKDFMSANNSQYSTDLSPYDYIALDYLFNIYISLCGKYNHRITVKDYCLMVNINSNTFTDIVSSANANPGIVSLCNKLKETQEAGLLGGSQVLDMFLLKALHGYSDTPTQTIADIQTVAALPDIFGKYDKLLPPDEI